MEQVIKNKHLNFEIRFRYGNKRCERFIKSLEYTNDLQEALKGLESIYKCGGVHRFFDFSKAGENKEILYNKIITLDKQYN
ncbi:hypothetical protein T36_0539 [Helicobacter cinaedi]|uniref:hypothetical protein n=1 Tax=Helicobacter cinaedi TaxID=213 RepID=UPI001F1F1A43|nr:hypothetical protein [Helicobacter cinaedi]BDB64092.1 hypothetical protein T36_0539 [Helicobacter cinaedi]